MRCPNRTSRQTPAASPWLSQLVLSLPNQNLRGSGVASRRRRRRSHEALIDLGEDDLEACGRGERFWTETAAEYTSAKALSVSSTKIAINGRAPRPRTLRVIRKA